MLQPLIATCVLVGVLVGSSLVLPVSAMAQAVAVRADPTAPPKTYGGLLHARGPHSVFEVATIRPSAPDEAFGFTGITFHANGVEATAVSIRDAIEFA